MASTGNLLNSKANLQQRLQQLELRISTASRQNNRCPAQLLAVSKTRTADEIRALAEAGQRHFGENHLREAVPKINALRDLDLCWHYIGRIQSNKTADIAAHFHWVHSIGRLKDARRLAAQRATHLPPLNICIQVNIDAENSKSGVRPDEVLPLARAISTLTETTRPTLKLRGLMCIPAPTEQIEQQHLPFRRMHQLMNSLQQSFPHVDTLSMGMSNDFEAAITEGSTIVRIGTALFGPRSEPPA